MPLLAAVFVVLLSLAGAGPASAQEQPAAPGAPGDLSPAADPTDPGELAQGFEPSKEGGVQNPEQGDEGSEGGDDGGKQASCEGSGVGKSFAGGMLTPGENFDTSFTHCPLEHYYLQYVDFTNWTGVFNPGRGLNAAPKHALNSIASIVFEFNAKLIYYVIAILNYALAFNLLDELGEPAQKVMSALGEGFFKVWLPAMYGLAILYGAWLSLWRNQVAEGFAGILKAAVIGAFGVWLVMPGNAAWSVEKYNDLTGALTNTAFCAVSQVDAENRADPGKECSTDGSAVSQDIWDRYVLDPWARLQIFDSNQQKANEHAEEILAIADTDEREAELKSLGQNDEEIKSTVDFIYASKHLTGAMLMLIMSIFFTLLIASVSILLLISEVIVLILILTSPVWLLPAVYPGNSLSAKALLWLVEETVQILGYKLLLGIFLILVKLIFAAGFGIGTVFLLCIVLSLVCFRFRHDLRRFFQPRGLVNGLRDRYDRNRELRRDQAALGGGGARGGLSPAGAGGATGDLSAGQARRPQKVSNIRQAVGEARAGGFMPDAVGAAASGYARRSASGGYRGGRQAVGAVAAAGGMAREESYAPIAAARRLESLSEKRAQDPGSLTQDERRELETAERMVDAGKDPTSRIRPGARKNQRAAREEFKRRQEQGFSAGEQLAGPRLPGESEAEYRERQRLAREEADGSRRRIQDLAADPEHQHGIGPFGQRPGADDPGDDRDGENPNEDPDDKKRSCRRCGAGFVALDPGQTLCPLCEGGPRTDDPGPDDTTTNPRPGVGLGAGATTAGGTGSERPEAQDQQAARPGASTTGTATGGGADSNREPGREDGREETGSQARRPGGIRPPVDMPDDAEYDPQTGRIRGLVPPGGRAPEAPTGYTGSLETAATQDGGEATYYTWDPDRKPEADVKTGDEARRNGPSGAGAGDLHPQDQARWPESSVAPEGVDAGAAEAEQPGFFSAERAKERMRAGEEVREAQQRGMREGAARGAVRGAQTGGAQGAVAGAGAGLVGGGLAEGGKTYKDNLGRMWSGTRPEGADPASPGSAGSEETQSARRPEPRPARQSGGGDELPDETTRGGGAGNGAGNVVRKAAEQAKQQAKKTAQKAARNVEEATRAARDELEGGAGDIGQAAEPQARRPRERLPLREPNRGTGDRTTGDGGSKDKTGGR